jgi:hypothetical protein
MRPSPAIVATIHKGILPVPDTAFPLLKIEIELDEQYQDNSWCSQLVKEITGKQ